MLRPCARLSWSSEYLLILNWTWQSSDLEINRYLPCFDHINFCCWSWNEHFYHQTIWASDQQSIWASGDSKMKKTYLYPDLPTLQVPESFLHSLKVLRTYTNACYKMCLYSGLQCGRVKVAIWRTQGDTWWLICLPALKPRARCTTSFLFISLQCI